MRWEVNLLSLAWHETYVLGQVFHHPGEKSLPKTLSKNVSVAQFFSLFLPEKSKSGVPLLERSQRITHIKVVTNDARFSGGVPSIKTKESIIVATHR
jgi:hypothetical protein